MFTRISVSIPFVLLWRKKSRRLSLCFSVFLNWLYVNCIHAVLQFLLCSILSASIPTSISFSLPPCAGHNAVLLLHVNFSSLSFSFIFHCNVHVLFIAYFTIFICNCGCEVVLFDLWPLMCYECREWCNHTCGGSYFCFPQYALVFINY